MAILHFHEAVEQHHKWLDRLTAALQDSLDDFHEREIVHDDACVIGQWLYGDGLAFEGLAEFKKVKELHKELHAIAAKAWMRKVQGNLDDIQECLNEIKEAGHALFMSWSELNLQIGALD
ncbi:CZB domain-containing protein [Magnetovibrio sp.]|uniref:CZB domain-containing protein n=1 Tax=Magnetovibrio sp. TaxID=2024836 RepID=UPI002F920B63